MSNKVIYSTQTIEFVTVANEFCLFIERTMQFSKPEFIRKLHKILPLLYLKTSLIPQIESEFDIPTEKFVTEDNYNYLQKMLLAKFGKSEEFIAIYEPFSTVSDEAIQTSLSEAITDIYQDLKDFLIAFEIGVTETMNEALWECKQNFEQLWGQRIVALLGALHNIIYSEADLDESSENKHNESDINTSSWLINKQFDNFCDEV